eukprot:gb/GEZJ01006156.1/.p1 GENE.gb/GEZJ01006156.1/~~gb/GEZJ01006156.1/.p1  ORF type:complete len:106 (+),score=14.90 gb/GEZJ01006156.1/:177-494(+)
MGSSNYGVVSVIQPPSLKSVDQLSLINFGTAFILYCSKVEGVNKDRNEEIKISSTSIKIFIEAATLHAFCIQVEIPGIKNVIKATVKNVQAWFDAASSSAPKDLA